MRLSSSFLTSVYFSVSALAAYDGNRAGAVLKAPSGDSFQSVTGTFVVPALTGPNRLTIWLGIGNNLDQTYVLGGGVVYNSTLGSFAAFFPEKSVDTTSSLPVAAGDSITVTTTLTSPNTGTVVIENKTQNKKSESVVAAPSSANVERLTAQAADWWVQAYQAAGELVRTPVYDNVTFTDVSATLASGTKVGATGAGNFEIQGISGEVFSKTTIEANKIVVKRQTVAGPGGPPPNPTRRA